MGKLSSLWLFLFLCLKEKEGESDLTTSQTKLVPKVNIANKTDPYNINITY